MTNKLFGIRLEPELWRRVKVRAAERGLTANALVAEALLVQLSEAGPSAPALNMDAGCGCGSRRAYGECCGALQAPKELTRAAVNEPTYVKDEYSQ